MRVLVPMVVCAGVATAAPVVSEFGSSAEGWVVSTRTSGSGFLSEVASYTPDWFSSGGDPGGYASEVDPDSNWSFFKAPAPFLGDQSGQSGRELRFSVQTSRLELAEGRLVILVGGGGLAISHMIPTPTLNAWTRQRIPLRVGYWKASSNGAGTDADQARIDAVLSNLQTFLIGMEYGSDALEEIVGIDSVVLGACTADLAAPFGVLNIFDIQAFLNLYNAQDAGADLASPFGTFNIFDIQAFIGLYNQGCP